MKRLLFSMLFYMSFIYAQGEENLVDETQMNSADCLILQDENSIICKYLHERVEEDKEIIIQWIDPDGEISRERPIIIPAGHGSIYDFRYVEGRKKGLWQFKVIEDDIETTATFSIE